MERKIEGLENISKVFSVFHDGRIIRCVKTDTDLEFDVEIQYLTERINPQFKIFNVVLEVLGKIYFSTWPNDSETSSDLISDVNSIFKPELEILNGEVENEAIKVWCNQSSPGYGYCGGDLYIAAESAIVRDEAGKTYSIEELCSLSIDYWNEWARGKKT